MARTDGQVYWELGKAGLSWDEVQQLQNAAMTLASRQRQMGPRGVVLIPGTERVLVYDGGMDGWDAHYYIEDVKKRVPDYTAPKARTHKVTPLDSMENMWRCGLDGTVFQSDNGYVYCPHDTSKKDT